MFRLGVLFFVAKSLLVYKWLVTLDPTAESCVNLAANLKCHPVTESFASFVNFHNSYVVTVEKLKEKKTKQKKLTWSEKNLKYHFIF